MYHLLHPLYGVGVHSAAGDPIRMTLLSAVLMGWSYMMVALEEVNIHFTMASLYILLLEVSVVSFAK
jgi:hypothetical protein